MNSPSIVLAIGVRNHAMEAQPRASLSAFHGNGHLGRGCQLRQRHAHQDDGPAQLQPAGDRLFPVRVPLALKTRLPECASGVGRITQSPSF
eukprot:6201535-Pleurochrysis_carterae.AAC.3